MVTLHGKNLSWSSSTGDSDSSSEDDGIRFYNQPSGSRQKSSSSSSESDSEDFSGGSSSEPKRTAEDPSSSMKVKKNGKRIREEVTGWEEALGEKKSARNSSYTGGKRSPPRQSETLLKGSAEKIRAKSRKEKKSSTSTDENSRGKEQSVEGDGFSTPVKEIQHVWSYKDEGGRTAAGQQNGNEGGRTAAGQQNGNEGGRTAAGQQNGNEGGRTAAEQENGNEGGRTAAAQQNGNLNWNGNGFMGNEMARINELRNEGRRASMPFSIINKELMDGMFGFGGFVLNEAQVEKLEFKWLQQNVVEMEAFSGRLRLLEEECKMYLEQLKSSSSRRS